MRSCCSCVFFPCSVIFRGPVSRSFCGGPRRRSRTSVLSIPPCGLVSFSMSPSKVFAPANSSSSSGVTSAIVVPLEPPISGLRTRSTLVGLFSFTCLVLMTCPSKLDGCRHLFFPYHEYGGYRVRRRRRIFCCAGVADHRPAVSRRGAAPWRFHEKRRVRPGGCSRASLLKSTWCWLLTSDPADSPDGSRSARYCRTAPALWDSQYGCGPSGPDGHCRSWGHRCPFGFDCPAARAGAWSLSAPLLLATGQRAVNMRVSSRIAEPGTCRAAEET